MSGTDLLDLRAVLVRRRAALLGTLRTAVAQGAIRRRKSLRTTCRGEPGGPVRRHDRRGVAPRLRRAAAATEVRHLRHPPWGTFNVPANLIAVCHGCNCREHSKES
jgi:hypothetical protein